MVLLLAVSVLLVATDRSWSQTLRKEPIGLQEREAPPLPPAPIEPQPPPASQAPPDREKHPGLLNEMGKLFGRILPSNSWGDAGNAGAKDSTKGRADDTSGTSEALSRLARPSTMVSGRAVCPRAANGTSDCKLGADKLCQGKGYKEGNSLNTDSAETCSAKVLIPGRARKPDDCHTDTYVTSALCQ